MLHINDLQFRHGGRAILESATAAIEKGWRVGLVGRNGSGKTTLLRLIAGEIKPDRGTLNLARRLRVGRVAQEAPGGERSLIDTVLAADEERTRLLTESASCHDPQRIAELHERLAAIRAESAPARAARILAGLGFDEAAQQRPCGSYSGGWRMRVALAALLFAEPDLLLLDEPTNHLDLEAALWLESFLLSYGGTIILVSHDRGLLNRVPNRILALQAGRLTLYNGNYDAFERTRRERLARQAAENAKIEAQRRHIQSFVDRFRYKASKARQAQSRLKALARLEPIVSLVEERTVALDFPEPEALSPPILTLEGVAAGYGEGRPVLSGLDLRLDMEDRVALLGANGNGKSTFARLLAGRLRPQKGRYLASPKLRVGYFAQDQAEALDLAGTPLSHLAALMPQEPESRLRSHLGRFGFSGERADLAVAKLSGGEKARLNFALISRERPHLLILDEPTNHLDIDAREALVQALNAYGGAVVLISHEEHLIETVAERLWLVQGGGIRPYEGDLEDYRRLLLEQRRTERREARGQGAQADGSSRKDQRRAAAEARKAVAHLKRASQEAERKLEALAAQRRRLEAELAEPALYDGPSERLLTLTRRHAEVLEATAEAESAWLAAQAALESGQPEE